MRIPNASPCGILSNFETRCTEFFHPNVLAYVLRNRAAQLSRNVRAREDLNDHVSAELWRMGAAVVSSSCHLEPQTAATLLLSFAKLGVTLPDAVREITATYKFNNATPKAISLTLNAFSRHPNALEHISNRFWFHMTESIENTAYLFNPQDVATCALSLTGILASYRNNRENITIDRDTVKRLRSTYRTMLKHADRILNNSGPEGFRTRDLYCLLLSVYSSNVDAHKLIIAALGIDDTILLLDMMPPPDFVAATLEERRIKRDVVRAEKAFVEWCFQYLNEYLDCLKERELARVAAACNRLRCWSQDSFAINFADAWTNTLRSTDKMAPNILNHGICYFMRRYETSVSRELSAVSPEEQQRIAKVSDACARIGEMLHEHAKSHYTPEELRKVEELIHIADQCRVKRAYKTAPR
ncbi:hypothetical protein BgAZ_104440 [Babesia gibsoni]|uniref:Uncharacterized protein n=1 Tax=Babesia gibsoni TaxID=33632 RepID=A0AAD8UVE9_BABGI|nr:hypothetical protein BgAZ_104440 [Babesia gibsoni]